MLAISHNFYGSVSEFSVASLFLAFFFGTFVSEDAACLLAGTMAANGRISFALALTACFLGIFAGDVILYATGRAVGERLFENRFVRRFVSEKSRKRAAFWLESHGASAVFFTRFVTGLRLPTYLAAGALRTNFTRFTIYFLAASAIWTPILVGSTYFSQSYVFNKNALIGLIITAVIFRFTVKLSSWKNRRLLIGRMKRCTNWEFWPLPIFYAPVIAYIFILALRHRSLTTFTAVNPGMPAGGFKGESKSDIYRSLRNAPAASKHLPLYTLVAAGLSATAKIERAKSFIEANNLNFPVVLKPDVGERGKGVSIIDSEKDLRDLLSVPSHDLIIQEFVPGPEVSVFYYRYPGSERGEIFSTTEKRFPVVTGDGTSTLEELILQDARAICLAKKYFEQNRAGLDTVPLINQSVELVKIGTHSRGAVFLDGGNLKTPALESAIEDIGRGIEGFYFGRFDIRASSLDDLMRGRNFQLIELNGVTSESTNIYDPRHSLIDAYRILFRQWRLAFEIGELNVKLGARTTTLRDLFRAAVGIRWAKA
jgi:membrane protein DedA with SNARE-associated domain